MILYWAETNWLQWRGREHRFDKATESIESVQAAAVAVAATIGETASLPSLGSPLCFDLRPSFHLSTSLASSSRRRGRLSQSGHEQPCHNCGYPIKAGGKGEGKETRKLRCEPSPKINTKAETGPKPPFRYCRLSNLDRDFATRVNKMDGKKRSQHPSSFVYIAIFFERFIF